MQYPKSDRWHRPLITPPGGGTAKGYTRTTTVAKALNGMEGLSIWQQRMAVGGASLRPDLLLQVSANWPPTEKTKRIIDGYVEEMKDAAAADAGANMGDALHLIFARLDTGEVVNVMAPFDQDVNARQKVITEAGLTFEPDHIEQTVVLDSIGVAGSFDRLAGKDGGLYIFDDKTGSDLGLAWPSIAIQLAIYSRAETVYDWDDESHRPMPEVNQKIGLVMHTPAGQGRASLHVVDLEAGWEAAQIALWVRDWRSRKNLARPARLNGSAS